MKSISIELKKSGYEPFLDFLKAYAIICVLLGHTFIPFLNKIGYPFWGGLQVPIFALIQAFHILKKPSYSLNFKKLFIRIILPFFIFQIGIILVFLIKNTSFNQIVNMLFWGGGYGPGSYYPWIYIQLVLILYLVRPILTKGNLVMQAIMWIGICEGFEIIESYANVSDLIHRLSATRYLFLIFLAWIWIKNGIVINKFTLFLSILSMFSIAYFLYCDFNNEPFFYNTVWSYHRWPCYFYVSILLCYLLNILYKMMSKVSCLDKAIKLLAKCSYEIFLVQMAVIAIFPSPYFIENKNFSLFLWILFVWTVSLIGGYFFNKVYSITLKRII